MGLQALIEQAMALVHAKTVLLIHHHQAEAGEAHRILQQGVGAHQNFEGAVVEVGQQLAAPLGGGGAGEQGHGHMELGQPLAELLVMLGRQHLRGRHQGPLAAGIDGREQGRNRHHGFATAHIPLHQPGHRLVPGQVGVDFGQHPPLGAGEREGQDLQKGPHQAPGLARAIAIPRRPLGRQGQGRRRVGGELAAPLQQAELQHQKFIKHQPPPGRRQPLLVVGLVDLDQGRGQIEELLLPHQRARQRVPPGLHRPQQGLDRLANPVGREPLGEPIDGQQPADLAALQGRIRALQHLH